MRWLAAVPAYDHASLSAALNTRLNSRTGPTGLPYSCSNCLLSRRANSSSMKSLIRSIRSPRSNSSPLRLAATSFSISSLSSKESTTLSNYIPLYRESQRIEFNLARGAFDWPFIFLLGVMRQSVEISNDMWLINMNFLG